MSSVIGQAESVKHTFSSWDACMSESYCKWPVIIAIIVVSLIVLSVIWCCARCLCCGAECCCAMCSCFNSCCPSPRRKNDGYQQPPPTYPPSRQYQNSAPPMYYGNGGGGPGASMGPNGFVQTATFDAPSRKYNDDALPAMPSWGNAATRRVEQEPEEEEVEMEKLDQHPAQQQSLLHQQRTEEPEYDHYNGDIGAMHANPYQTDAGPYQHEEYSPYGHEQTPGMDQTQAANPYHDYAQHQQQTYAESTTSPTIASSVYPPTYHTRPPSFGYESQTGGQAYGAPPPTYRTAPSSIASPPPQQQQQRYSPPQPQQYQRPQYQQPQYSQYQQQSPPQQHAQPQVSQQHVRMPSSGSYNIGRKPVSGSWRDL